MGRITPTKIVLAACALLALIIFASRGCQGDGQEDFSQPWGGMTKEEWMKQKAEKDKKQAKLEAEEKAETEKDKKEQLKKAKENAKADEDARKSEKKRRARKSKEDRNDDEAPPPARPKNFADWKIEDYLAAKQKGDHEIDKAIRHLASQCTDKKAAVEILLKLLEPGENDSASNSSRRSGRGRKNETKILEDLIVALADVNTPEAWKAVEQLAAGKIRTADDLKTGVAAAELLVERPSPENDEALLRLVTAEDVNSGYEDDGVRIRRREKIFALATKSAGESFRLRLAKRMTDSELPRKEFDELWACLAESRPENMIPQIMLYQSGRLPPDDVEDLEKRFASVGDTALCRLLGAPLPAKLDKDSDSAPEDRRAVAGRLWRADFANAVKRRLLAVDSLDKKKDLLSLAAAIPDHSLRKAVHDLLELNWDKEPKALESIGFGEDVIPEPGFLVAVKMLDRADPPPSSKSRDSSKRTANKRGGSSKGSSILEARQQREKIAQAWMEYSRELTQAMCRQFREAALLGARTGRRTGTDLDPKSFAVPIHADARIVAAYKLAWPDELDGETTAFKALSPLKVHYVRIDQMTKPSALLGFYRRQLPAHDEHALDDSVWLDAVDRKSDPAQVRSIDVFIQASDLDDRRLASREQRTVVEILFIQCEAFEQSTAKTNK